ncbi:MAG: type II toxin-antitoxin system VapC family toxin [Trueperaceae bacterium]|nr:MAG: type II toxin-antitoxin system VapC family toxin [Trueperaceae bacterium]
MAFLFDTDAISEVMKPRPDEGYLAWLATVPRDDQFASAITIGELFYGAYRTQAPARHLELLASRILPAVTVLPFDTDVAHRYGRLGAELEHVGMRLADADLQIAATALHHGLELVTGNVRHFARVPALAIRPLRSSA